MMFEARLTREAPGIYIMWLYPEVRLDMRKEPWLARLSVFLYWLRYH